MTNTCQPGDHVYEIAANGKLKKCVFCGHLAVPEARFEDTRDPTTKAKGKGK